MGFGGPGVLASQGRGTRQPSPPQLAQRGRRDGRSGLIVGHFRAGLRQAEQGGDDEEGGGVVVREVGEEKSDGETEENQEAAAE